MTELPSKIDSLTAILKSSTLAIGKPEGKEKKELGKTMQKGGQRKRKKDWELQHWVHQKVIENLFNVPIVGDGDMDGENVYQRETSIGES